MDKQNIKFPVFVGHVFKQEQFDDLRAALDKAFSNVNFIQLVYADTARFQGALFPKIMRLIDSSMFCIFDISEQNTNVFLELGYALGRNKLCVPIIRAGATVPTDIAGLERLSYSSYKELTQVIKGKVQGFIQLALGTVGRLKKIADIEFLRYLSKHKGGQEVDVDAMKIALRTHNISGLDIDETVKLWLSEGFMAEQNGKITLTPLGEDFTLKMLKDWPKQKKGSRVNQPA